jgi:hypothetical protein
MVIEPISRTETVGYDQADLDHATDLPIFHDLRLRTRE